MAQKCISCLEGTVSMVAKDGRFFIYKDGVYVNLPRDFALPRCNNCNRDFVTPQLQEPLKKALEIEYQRDEALIELVVRRFRQSESGQGV